MNPYTINFGLLRDGKTTNPINEEGLKSLIPGIDTWSHNVQKIAIWKILDYWNQNLEIDKNTKISELTKLIHFFDNLNNDLWKNDTEISLEDESFGNLEQTENSFCFNKIEKKDMDNLIELLSAKIKEEFKEKKDISIKCAEIIIYHFKYDEKSKKCEKTLIKKIEIDNPYFDQKNDSSSESVTSINTKNENNDMLDNKIKDDAELLAASNLS